MCITRKRLISACSRKAKSLPKLVPLSQYFTSWSLVLLSTFVSQSILPTSLPLSLSVYPYSPAVSICLSLSCLLLYPSYFSPCLPRSIPVAPLSLPVYPSSPSRPSSPLCIPLVPLYPCLYLPISTSVCYSGPPRAPRISIYRRVPEAVADGWESS